MNGLFDFGWRWFAVFFSWLASLFVLGGCSVVDTGPIVTKAITENVTGAMKQLLAQYQPENMSVDVDGKINDPVYRGRIFVGTGVLVDIVLGVQGVDASLEFNTDGRGVEVPPEVAAEARSIMGNALLSETEKQRLLASLFEKWLLSTTQPTHIEMKDVSTPGDPIGIAPLPATDGARTTLVALQ